MTKTKPLDNAGSIEIEKMVTALYFKGILTKEQMKQLGDSILRMIKELPELENKLH